MHSPTWSPDGLAPATFDETGPTFDKPVQSWVGTFSCLDGLVAATYRQQCLVAAMVYLRHLIGGITLQSNGDVNIPEVDEWSVKSTIGGRVVSNKGAREP